MESSLINFLKEEDIENITNITDAMFEGDTSGTKANAAYFHLNVHKYFKHIAAALLTENTKYVSSKFELDNDAIGDPFYTTIAAAYAGLSTPGPSNKAYIYLTNCGTEYSESLTFGTDGYTVIEGSSKFGTVISGSVSITAGKHIFRNIKFNMPLSISGGTVLFENCEQVTGETRITGTATVVISKCGQWGNIMLEEDLTGVHLWCEDIGNMLKDGNGNSIVIPDYHATSEFVIRRVAAQGNLSAVDGSIKEISGFEHNISARPII